jgi:hypothetical protein
LPLFTYLRILKDITLRMKHESKRAQSPGGKKGLTIYTPLVIITVIASRWRDREGHGTRVEKMRN